MALGNFEIASTPFGRVLVFVSLAQRDGVRVCLTERMVGGVYPGTDEQECASIKCQYRYSSRMPRRIRVLNGKHGGAGSSFKGSGSNMGNMSCYFRVVMIRLLVRGGNLGHTSGIGLNARLPSV